ncbi:hypothetical protein JKP88DRAFT_255613 [Tribonema minus]|uniref:Uncharacterized protein n=1 Tax=Tribonema minus TaxID=303371 RepID=A0A835YYE1_9STRA|nr:hypothetical protein JKP88DRAFT_255613 [Tribonema minus]
MQLAFVLMIAAGARVCNAAECDRFFDITMPACAADAQCSDCFAAHTPIPAAGLPKTCYEYMELIYHQFPIPAEECNVYDSGIFGKVIRCEAKMATGNAQCLRGSSRPTATARPTIVEPVPTEVHSTLPPTIVEPVPTEAHSTLPPTISPPRPTPHGSPTPQITAQPTLQGTVHGTARGTAEPTTEQSAASVLRAGTVASALIIAMVMTL